MKDTEERDMKVQPLTSSPTQRAPKPHGLHPEYSHSLTFCQVGPAAGGQDREGEEQADS